MKSQAIKAKHRSINDIRKPRKPKSLTIKQHYAHVIALCTNYLEQKLTVNNCIDTILFADSHGMERLSRLTAMFIDVNFEMVFTSDEFLELNTSQLIALMPLLLYNEMSEDDMKNAVLLWSKYKQSERKKSSHLMRWAWIETFFGIEWFARGFQFENSFSNKKLGEKV